jgi:hypothetical protein
MFDLDGIRVERIRRFGGVARSDLHWFQVLFGSRSGRCFISSTDAERLGELNVEWVKRALLNLAVRRGRGWLEDALLSSPGLRLRHSDASAPWGHRAPDPRGVRAVRPGRPTALKPRIGSSHVS